MKIVLAIDGSRCSERVVEETGYAGAPSPTVFRIRVSLLTGIREGA